MHFTWDRSAIELRIVSETFDHRVAHFYTRFVQARTRSLIRHDNKIRICERKETRIVSKRQVAMLQVAYACSIRVARSRLSISIESDATRRARSSPLYARALFGCRGVEVSEASVHRSSDSSTKGVAKLCERITLTRDK